MIKLLLTTTDPIAAAAWRAVWCSVRDPGPQQQALLGFAALAICQGITLPDPPDILLMGERERDRIAPRVPLSEIGPAVQKAMLLLLPEGVVTDQPAPAPPPPRRADTGQPAAAGGATSQVETVSTEPIPPPPNGAGPALIKLYHAALGSPSEPSTPTARAAYRDALHARGA